VQALAIVAERCCRMPMGDSGGFSTPALWAVVRANNRGATRADVPAEVGELLVDALESHGVV
jgi:hypothetical protein